MHASRLAVLLGLAVLLASSSARADCPRWEVGPFTGLGFSNGANGTVGVVWPWDPDGAGPLGVQLVAAGGFTSMQGTTAIEIAAKSAETGAWSPLGSGLSGQAICMTEYNGDLVVAGTLATAGGTSVNEIARWDGSSWHALGTGITGTYVRAMTVYNGMLIAGGTFTNAGGVTVSNIAAWDGSSWHALGSGITGFYVVCLSVWNGNLVAGGVFTNAGGVPVSNVAQWNGSSWSAMGSGLVGAVASLQPYNGYLWAAVQSGGNSYMANWNGSSWGTSATFSRVTINVLTARTGALYAAGSALNGTGQSLNAVWEFDGANLVDLGTSGIVGTILGATIYQNELVVGGSFSQADGRTANRIAHWDDTSWGSYGGGTATSVSAMTEFLGHTVAAGDFHQSLPTMPEAHDILSWDDATMSSFGTGMDGPVLALKAFKYTGIFGSNEIVAGGTFSHAGGVAASNIARWNVPTLISQPINWLAMGPGFNGPVYAIERFSNATYAGGSFSASGGTGVSNIARWNATSSLWEALSTGMNGPVYALKVFGSYLYAGGAFTSAGGVSTGGLARWDGASWSAVGGFFNGTVNALEVHGGQLVIGGTYPGIGGSPNLAQYNGSSYSTLGTGGTNAVVRTLHSTGPHLYVGGDFTSIGGVAVNHIGEWDGTWHDVTGGTDNSVYALTNYNNHVQVGGTFQNADFGAFIGSPRWVRWDETGIPMFRQQPFSQTATEGATVSFTAVPDTGYTGLTLQWLHDNVPLADGPTGHGSTLSGTHGEVLNIAGVETADLGNYRMVITSGCGTDSSAIAALQASAGVGPGEGLAPSVFEGVDPNPSAGTTRMVFSLARPADVRLVVHDVAGRTVRAADLGRLGAGRGEWAWDARDAAGSRVRAGLYFVVMTADGRTIGRQRMALVR